MCYMLTRYLEHLRDDIAENELKRKVYDEWMKEYRKLEIELLNPDCLSYMHPKLLEFMDTAPPYPYP